MAKRHLNLSKDEIAAAFRTPSGDPVPPILSPEQLADLLGYSVKTIYEWIAKGRLDGCFRKRGKHIRIYRDRAIALFFNGPEWNDD